MQHASLEAIRELRIEKASRPLLLHVLGCPQCRAKLHLALSDSPEEGRIGPAPLPASLQRVLERTLKLRDKVADDLRSAFQAAGPVFDELVGMSPEDQDAAIDTDGRFQTPGVCLWLLEAAQEAITLDPRRSERLASLALSIVERLPPPWADVPLASELRVRCWMWIGEVRRVLTDRQGAENAFQRAVYHLAPEDLSTPDRALLCRFLGRLRLDEERVDEALALFARAVALLEQLGDFAGLAEALADQGWLYLEEEEVEIALTCFLGGVSLVNPRTRPHTALSLRHGLALSYAELGQPAKAEKVIAASREELRASLADPVDQLALSRFEAEILERNGDFRRAITGLQFVVVALLDLGEFHDAASATVQLARCYTESTLTGEILRFRLELESLWRQTAIPEELSDLITFVLKFATEPKAEAFELLERVSVYLKAARYNSDAQFRPRDAPTAEIQWDTLDSALRLQVCSDAGLEEGVAGMTGQELSNRLQRRISWTLEQQTGVRILFGEACDG